MAAPIDVREQAVASESLGVGAKTREATKLQTEIKDKRQKQKDSEVMEELASPQKPDVSEASLAIEKNFGTQRDKNGEKTRASGSQEERRFNDAKKHEALARELLTKKYDGLTQRQKDELRKLATEGVLDSREAIRGIFEQLSDPEKQVALEEALNDPRVREQLSQVYNEVFSGENSIQDEVETLGEQRKKIEEDLRETRATLARTNGEWNSLMADLEEYKVKTSAGREGKVYREIEDIKADMPNLKAEEKRLTTQAAPLYREKETLERELKRQHKQPEISQMIQRISEIDTELDPCMQDLAEVQGKIRKPEEYEKRRQELEERVKKLGEERDPLREKESDLKNKKRETDIKYNDQMAVRGMREEEYLSRIKGMVPEATRRYFEKRYVENDRLAKEAQVDQTEQKNKGIDEYMLQGQIHRWVEEKTRGVLRTRKDEVVKKDQVREDIKKWLENGNTEPIIKDILGKLRPPLSPAEISKAMADKDFVDRWDERIAFTLTRRGLDAKVLTAGNVRTILDIPKYSEMINQAAEKNAEAKKVLDQLRREGKVKGTFCEWIKAKSDHSIVKLLLLLLGTAALGAAPLYYAAKNSLD